MRRRLLTIYLETLIKGTEDHMIEWEISEPTKINKYRTYHYKRLAIWSNGGAGPKLVHNNKAMALNKEEGDLLRLLIKRIESVETK